jgi:bifunctional non-homologous end joining protein LigD
MLATSGPLPAGDGWVYEIKWDGIRALVAVRAGGSVKVTTRLGNDATAAFPELAGLGRSLAAQGAVVVLDGEIVAFGTDGRPSFTNLQQRLGLGAAAAAKRATEVPVVFAAFDLLHLNGMSTRSLPWSARRSLLERLWPGDGPAWRLPAVHDDGDALMAAVRTADLEGVVAKRRDAPYLPGRRTPTWVKVKHVNVDDVVIGAWVSGDRSRAEAIGALMVGTPVSGGPGAQLRYLGRVGTGFTNAELVRLRERFTALATDANPFAGFHDPAAHYLIPVLRCRVEYREITPDGVMRHPSYKGLVP